jgi:hypothetical protein
MRVGSIQSRLKVRLVSRPCQPTEAAFAPNRGMGGIILERLIGRKASTPALVREDRQNSPFQSPPSIGTFVQLRLLTGKSDESWNELRGHDTAPVVSPVLPISRHLARATITWIQRSAFRAGA